VIALYVGARDRTDVIEAPITDVYLISLAVDAVSAAAVVYVLETRSIASMTVMSLLLAAISSASFVMMHSIHCLSSVLRLSPQSICVLVRARVRDSCMALLVTAVTDAPRSVYAMCRSVCVCVCVCMCIYIYATSNLVLS